MIKLEMAKLLDRHLHDTRHALVGDGLAIDRGHSLSVNALRGHLAEFGVIAAKAISHIDELVERAAADLPAMVLATRWRFCLRNCGISGRRSMTLSARSSPTVDAIRSAG